MPSAPRWRWFGLAAAVVGSNFIPAAKCAPEDQRDSAEPVEAREFDFWLGSWEVFSASGVLQGRNKIERVANGRGLSEEWSGVAPAGNVEGRSLNAWNSEKRQWQQFWIGSDGIVLELSGGLVGRSMVMTGHHHERQQDILEKITWTPNDDGSVRQLWEQSNDEGKTWRIVFDGRYSRIRPVVSISPEGPPRRFGHLLW